MEFCELSILVLYQISFSFELYFSLILIKSAQGFEKIALKQLNWEGKPQQ